VAIVRRSLAFRGRTVTVAGPSGFVAVVVAVSLLAVLAPQMVAGADTVNSKRAQAAALTAQLDALTVRASRAAEAYDNAQIRLQQVTAALAAARTQFGQTGSQLSGAQDRVKQMAIESYMQGGAASELSLLIPSTSDQLALRGTYVQAATGSDTQAIDSLRAARTALDHQQASLAAAQTQAQAAVTAAMAAQKAAADADAAVRATYARVSTELGQAVLQQALQDRVAAEQARVRALLRAGTSLLPPAASKAKGRRVPGTGAPFVGGLAAPTRPPPPTSPAAAQAVAFAEQQLGKPYMYGGGGGADYDCSGLTAWAWGHAGHALPHSSESQYYNTTHVSVADLQPGDLVFFGMPPHHVGIYVGGGEMINALHSGTNVEYDSIYVEGDLIGGGRVN
jgi:cell wall-associated NlpC family hydrolase